MLQLLGRAAPGSFAMIAGDVMHERLSGHEHFRLAMRLIRTLTSENVSRVLYEQHMPYIQFSEIFTLHFNQRPEPAYIQLLREPTARWVSMHYFFRACFCDTRGRTQPPAPRHERPPAKSLRC